MQILIHMLTLYLYRYIRLWDAHKEMKSADLPTGSDSYVSSLTFSSYYAASSTSGIFTAGTLETKMCTGILTSHTVGTYLKRPLYLIILTINL